jgi:hypothetical protein
LFPKTAIDKRVAAPFLNHDADVLLHSLGARAQHTHSDIAMNGDDRLWPKSAVAAFLRDVC